MKNGEQLNQQDDFRDSRFEATYNSAESLIAECVEHYEEGLYSTGEMAEKILDAAILNQKIGKLVMAMCGQQTPENPTTT